MKTIKLTLTLLISLTLGTAQAGFILLEPDNIDFRPAPVGNTSIYLDTRSINATVEIKDQFATTTIEQVFYNPYPAQVEGWFFFPVPQITFMKEFYIEFNGQQLQAELLDADKALSIYEEIVRKAKDPALMEYAGQGLYRVRVFPIEAQKEKKIKIVYSEALTFDNQAYEYRFPMNLKRYNRQNVTNIEININLSTAGELKTIYSPTHHPAVVRNNDHSARITLIEKDLIPETDFRFFFSVGSGEVDFSLLTYTCPDEAEGYFMLNITPKFGFDAGQIADKDITLVLDVSGSMAGEKLQQAKNALKYCISSLNPGDRFEVIKFSTESEALFGKRVQATPANVQKALSYVEGLKAIGGTYIEEALGMALTEPSDGQRIHSVIFITDGKPTIGETDEEKLMAAIRAANTRNTRIFTFGIGVELNTLLLDKIATETKAYRTYISPGQDIEYEVSNFFAKVKSPVLTNLALNYGNGVKVKKVFPKELPDIFQGGSILIFGRFEHGGDTELTLSGFVNGQAKEYKYPAIFKSSASHDFIPGLWAARNVGYLLDQIRLYGESQELKDEVVVLAKKYGIITPYTSYLILEDEKVDITTHVIEEDEVIFNNRFYEPGAFEQTVDDEYKSLRKKEGGKGVRSSSEVQNLNMAGAISDTWQGRSRMNYQNTKGENRNFGEEVINIQGRAVYQKENEWIDLYVQDKKYKNQEDVKFASPRYFELARQNKDMGQFLSLGPNVRFVYNNKLYVVTE